MVTLHACSRSRCSCFESDDTHSFDVVLLSMLGALARSYETPLHVTPLCVLRPPRHMQSCSDQSVLIA